MDSKQIFSENLRRHMELSRKTRKDISESLGISYYTVSDWVNGKKFPRMDKVEMLANLFGIEKSDLIEEESKAKNRNLPSNLITPAARPVPVLGTIFAPGKSTLLFRWEAHSGYFCSFPKPLKSLGIQVASRVSPFFAMFFFFAVFWGILRGEV